MKSWIASTYRKLHLDYHQPPWMGEVASSVTEADAERMARMFINAGIEAVGIFAYDHYGQAFYKSGVGTVHPGLAQEYTDVMNKALKKQGIKVILYFNALTSVHLLDTHPDWLIRDEQGNHPRGAWLQHDGSAICVSSPYIEQYFIPLLQEGITRFQPDAVWIDAGSWMIEYPCYCDHCVRAYLASIGKPLPRSPRPSPREELNNQDWLTWRLWRRSQIGSYLRKIIPAIKAVNQNILVAENNLGRSHSGVPYLEGDRLVKWLTPKELGVDWLSCDPVPNGGNHELILSIAGRYQSTTNLPFDLMNERFHGWGEWQYRSKLDWKLEAATIISVGGTCFFADQPYPNGTLEPKVYCDLEEVYHFIREREPFARGAVPVPEIAILASLPSQLFGPHGGQEWGRPPERCFNINKGRTIRVNGAHLALVELGMQNLLYDEETLREQLEHQSLVIVADQCLLEKETILALERYAEAGGMLFITGRSGLWDESGTRREQDPLQKLLGLSRISTHPAPIHYLRSEESTHPLRVEDILLQVWGAAMNVKLNGAEVIGNLLEPVSDVWRSEARQESDWQHYTVEGAAPPGQTIAGPGITLHFFGKGKVIYSSVDLFSLYYQEGHRNIREWIASCIGLLLPRNRRRLFCKKPLHIELSLMQQEETKEHPKRLLVHAVNYFAQKRQGILIQNEEVVPVRDIYIEVTTANKPRHVRLQPEGTELSFVWDASLGRVQLTIPEVNIHSLVEIVD